MKNPAPYIREKLVALLHETITYNSVQVPCYSGDGEVTLYQILIKDATDLDISTRDSFNGRWEQVIEIVSEQDTNMRRDVDAIGNSVLGIIKPTPRSSNLTGNSEFQIGAVKKIGQRYIDEESGEGTWINRLILRFSFLITEI